MTATVAKISQDGSAWYKLGCARRNHRLKPHQFLERDVHESLLHSRWIYTLGRMETFLHKFLWELPASTGSN